MHNRYESEGRAPLGERFEAHHNAFGFLRLLLASLVIVSHVPEIIYGDRRQELLVRLFGTISFGEVAVDGFFLISGYLITMSFERSGKPLSFLMKRAGRIYPGFIVASAVSVLIVAPLGGVSWQRIWSTIPNAIWNALTLQMPVVGGAFAGSHYPFVNGALWTIAHEARCYLVILALGMTGALRKPWAIAALAGFMLIAFSIDLPGLITSHTDTVDKVLRLTGVYLSGSLFYLWRDKITVSATWVLVSLTGLFACLLYQSIAELGVATFGAYLLFSFGQWNANGLFARVNNKNDISYGVYLYAWPTEKLTLAADPRMPILSVGFITLAGSLVCGVISWFAVEKPAMNWLRGVRRVPAPASPTT